MTRKMKDGGVDFFCVVSSSSSRVFSCLPAKFFVHPPCFSLVCSMIIGEGGNISVVHYVQRWVACLLKCSGGVSALFR